MDDQKFSLEERVARLEGKVGWGERAVSYLQEKEFWILSGIMLVTIIVAWIGFGFPNHIYQLIFAVLSVALLYHRNWFKVPSKPYHWILAVLNVLVFTMILKLAIGAGKVQPLSWVSYPMPGMEKVQVEKEEGLLGKVVPSMPEINVKWQQPAVSEWIVDLTIVQTFLVLITLIGGLFSFQPFVSFIAVFLVLFSLPALLTFNWHWVVGALILSSVGFYLQIGGTE